MPKEELIRAIIEACEALVLNTDTCCFKITAFFDYYFEGVGKEPARDDWPDRVLNPKLNGTNAMLKRLRRALGEFLPNTLPESCEKALKDFVRAGTAFIAQLESFHRTASLNVSYTSESDVFLYMTTSPENDMTWAEHRRNLRAKFKAMKDSFYKNSADAFEITNQIIEISRYYHPPKTCLSKYKERLMLFAAQQHATAASAKAQKVGLVVTTNQAVQLLRMRCEQENLMDFAVCERTFRNWERAGMGPAGYSVNCRVSVQAFMAWVDAYIIESRARAIGRLSIVRFCENRDSPVEK